MITLVNGTETTSLPVDDRGLQYGDGLFETIALRHGEPLLWQRHLLRLQEGCERLGLPMPGAQLLRQELARVASAEPRAVAKIIVTRGNAGRGYRPTPQNPGTRIVQSLAWPTYPADAAQGVAVCWCKTQLAQQPRLAGIKHLNRLEQILARAEWQDEYAEGLMRNSDGLVIEGTATNLFVVGPDGILVTPDLSQSGVAGVMRAQILESVMQLRLTCRVQPVSLEMIESAQELFLTNSLIGVWPIKQLETRRYVVGKISQKIQAALQAAHCVA